MKKTKIRFRKKALRTLTFVCMATLLYFVLGNGCTGIGHEAKEQRSYHVDVVEFSEYPSFEEARRGLVEVIRREPAENQIKADIEWASAGGELLGIMSILRDFQKKKPDVIVTLSSPCLEEALKLVRETPTVFGLCYNPHIMGFDEGHRASMSNFTGIYGEPPLEELVRIMELVKPGVKKIAVLWNPSEINSRYEMSILRPFCRERNLTIIEERLRSPNQICAKAQDLLELKPDAVILFADNILHEGFPSISSMLAAQRIPVFTDMIGLAEKGALVELGFDYYSWGQATGKMVLEVLGGKSPMEIPVKKFENLKLAVNLKTASKLNLSIPQEVLDRATQVIN